MGTYYQRNIEKLLNRANEHYKSNKERLRQQAKINIENYLTKEMVQEKNMGEIDIKICLKKISKD